MASPKTAREIVAPDEHQREQILEKAREQLRWAGSIAEFVETGYVPEPIHSGGGSYGDLGNAQEWCHNRQLVAIYFPTQAEWESHRRWHDFCRRWGYPFGELAGSAEVQGHRFPPRPCSLGKGQWVGLTWAKIRAALREEEPAPAPPHPSLISDDVRQKAREMVQRGEA